MIVIVSLLLSSSMDGLFGTDRPPGEILSAHAMPAMLTAGQNEVFDIAIRSPANNSNFIIEVKRDSQPVATYNINFINSSIKVISLKSLLPPSSGESTYTYSLYSGKIRGKKGAVSSLSEKRRIYSLRELSDVDDDGLRYFEEIEMGTEPALADTDGDTIPDNIDPEPIKASES